MIRFKSRKDQSKPTAEQSRAEGMQWINTVKDRQVATAETTAVPLRKLAASSFHPEMQVFNYLSDAISGHSFRALFSWQSSIDFVQYVDCSEHIFWDRKQSWTCSCARSLLCKVWLILWICLNYSHVLIESGGSWGLGFGFPKMLGKCFSGSRSPYKHKYNLSQGHFICWEATISHSDGF